MRTRRLVVGAAAIALLLTSTGSALAKPKAAPPPASPTPVTYSNGFEEWWSNSHVNSQDYAVVEQNDRRVADDFVVPQGSRWSINKVEVNGDYEPYRGAGTLPGVSPSGPAESVRVTMFRADAAGTRPGDEVATWNVVPTSGLDTGSFVLPLSPAASLPAGHYWLSVASVQNEITNGTWYWTVSWTVRNQPAALQWQHCPAWCAPAPGGPYDVQFRLTGTSVRA